MVDMVGMLGSGGVGGGGGVRMGGEKHWRKWRIFMMVCFTPHSGFNVWFSANTISGNTLGDMDLFFQFFLFSFSLSTT